MNLEAENFSGVNQRGHPPPKTQIKLSSVGAVSGALATLLVFAGLSSTKICVHKAVHKRVHGGAWLHRSLINELFSVLDRLPLPCKKSAKFEMEFRAAKQTKCRRTPFFPNHLTLSISQFNEKLDSVKSSVAIDGHFAPNFNLLHGHLKKLRRKMQMT